MTTHRHLLVRCLAAGALMTSLLAPSVAADACSQWSVRGEVTLVQSNGTSAKLATLEQAGSHFKGAANYTYQHERTHSAYFFDKIETRHASGPVVGSVTGNSFEATIYWSNASVGIYQGQIGPQGLLVGRTYDKTDPGATADFHSEKPFECLARVQTAPGLGSVPAKPTMALGRVQSSTPAASPTSICDAAQSARARNSPTAPVLERRCKEFTAALNFTPRVVEPAPGSVHRPQTAMAIRVAPGTTVQDSAYEIEIQVKANFDWRVLTHIPVNAAVAQSGLGYRAWGAHAEGSGAQMTAIAGAYRLRATATAPKKSAPSAWVEFQIAGTPGATKDELARSKLGATDGARAAFGLPAKAATTEAPRTQAHGAPLPAGTVPVARPAAPPLAAPAAATLSATASRGDAVSLNPQPLPPKLAITQSPLSKATGKADAVSLNPQPLPPASPVLLPNQAPSALR